MISVFGSCVGREELEEIATCLDKQWMGIGPKTAEFERAFAERRGLPGMVLLDSGSNSLYVALRLLDLAPGSEVIVPSWTWIACGHAVVIAGCKPVFCDVDYETQNLTAATVEPRLGPRTAAIMAVHYAGRPVRLDELQGLGLPILEDAAHAVDSTLQGKPCGGIGEVGIYSFDAIKNLATPEGGGVTARDPERLARAKLLRYCGIGKSGFEASAERRRWWEYHVGEYSLKFLPNDINASIGLAQLRKLDRLQAVRRSIWETYQRELAGLDWLTTPPEPAPDERHSYFTYLVRITNGRRDQLAGYLYEQGVYTTVRFHPLHLNAIYGCAERLPVCERLNEEALNLPLHPMLSDGDVDKVIQTVREFGKR